MSDLRGVLAGILGIAAGTLGCGERPPLDRLAGGAAVAPLPTPSALVTVPAGVDAAEEPETVQLASVAADQSLTDISVDTTGVYFAVAWYPDRGEGGPGSDTQGAVRRVPREGGETVELWQGQGAAYGVGAGTTAIYFITYEYRSSGRAGYVWSVSRAGEPARRLDGWRSQGSNIGFAVDGDAVYWGHSAGSSGALNRTNGVDGTTLDLVPQVSSPWGLATDGGSVFYVSYHGVFGVPVTGGPSRTIWDHPGSGRASLAVSAAMHTLFASIDDGGVVGLDLSDGHLTVLTDAPAADLTTDDAFVYWVDVGGGRILKAPLAGQGPPTPVISGLARPVAIALDDQFVYWVDADAHAVMRARK